MTARRVFNLTRQRDLMEHPRGARLAVGPRRTTASFQRYADAEAVVDHLLEHGVPGDRIVIVAADLRFVEDATGRVGYGVAAAQGAAAGAAIGALFGFVAGLLRWVEPLVAGLTLGLYGLALGAVLGAAAGAVLHQFAPKAFSSTGRLDAGRYDVMVDEGHAARAAELLERPGAGRPGDGSSNGAASLSGTA